MTPAYTTAFGSAFVGDSRELLRQLGDGSLNLVMTSPPFALRPSPFALQRKKAYGNKEQHEYVNWLAEFGQLVFDKLADDGSFVIDIGGAYEKGIPVRSLYPFRILIKFCDEIGFRLAEEFYWHNPSKLPSPIEWVNKRKIRTKDSVNTVWWFSKTPWPKANVSNVLAAYSDRMKKLIEDPDKFYQPKLRPSGHDISRGFARDNGGAIPPNLLSFPNTESNGRYMAGCRAVGKKPHPARFPGKLPEFFIKFLTDPGDTVLDIFAGSNTAGEMAERLGRRWMAFEERRDYVAASAFRFADEGVELQRLYTSVLQGDGVQIEKRQGRMILG